MLTTQMSVQRPTSSRENVSPSAAWGNQLGQPNTAEGRLFHHVAILPGKSLGHCLIQLPAICTSDAVGDR